MKPEGMGRHNHDGTSGSQSTERPSPDTAFSCTVSAMALQRADIRLVPTFCMNQAAAGALRAPRPRERRLKSARNVRGRTLGPERDPRLSIRTTSVDSDRAPRHLTRCSSASAGSKGARSPRSDIRCAAALTATAPGAVGDQVARAGRL